MSTCVIHIGMHKTGSTSIQNSLDGYSDDEFYYSSLGPTPNHSLPIYSLFSPNPERHRLHRTIGRHGSELKTYIESIRTDLEYSISETNGRTMIISGEGITGMSRDALILFRNSLLKNFQKIDVVAYIRPPGAFINSSFQGRVKSGLGQFTAETLYRPYKNTFIKFDEVFGEDNVHFKKFTPKDFPDKCVVTDFCLRLKIDLPKAKIKTANESMPTQAICLLYTYNKFLNQTKDTPLTGAQATSLVNHLNIENVRKFSFSPEIISPILDANHGDIAWMEDRMGESLYEDLAKHEQGDVCNEADLLTNDPIVIKQLISCLGKSAPKNVSADTADGVAQLVHAVRKKMGLNITMNQPKVKRINKQTILNRARINRAEPGVVTGWAIGPDSDQPVKVTLLVNGKKRASTTANEMRKGLYERGIHPNGRCGFVFKFHTGKHLKINDEVSIQITGGEPARGRLTANIEASKQEKKKTTKKTPIELPAKEIVNKLRAKKHNAKEIILHVGHGKTGSSYLQSALALSVKKLKVLGIDYPTHHSFTAARSGFISSGNVLCCEQWMSNLVAKVIEAKQGRILFSNELLFMKILNHHEVFAETFKDMKVNIVLFIRNPVNHMLSSYGQVVKRSGRTHPVNIFANRYNVVQCVHEFIEVCDDQNFTLKVINYSNRSHDLCAAFEEGLNIPAGTLELPPITNINRSLTASELEIQRLFNLYYNGKSSSFISDILCNELSDIKSKKVSLSNQAQAEFVGRMSKDVESVNEKLSPDSQYSLPSNVTSKDTVEQDVFTFNKKQLEVLISSICKEMNRDNGSAKNKNCLDDKSKKSSEQIKRLKGH